MVGKLGKRIKFQNYNVVLVVLWHMLEILPWFIFRVALSKVYPMN